MRCSCAACAAYMVHSESMRLGCVCPECGARCDACLGTDTVIDRERLKRQIHTYSFEDRFHIDEESARDED